MGKGRSFSPGTLACLMSVFWKLSGCFVVSAWKVRIWQKSANMKLCWIFLIAHNVWKTLDLQSLTHLHQAPKYGNTRNWNIFEASMKQGKVILRGCDHWKNQLHVYVVFRRPWRNAGEMKREEIIQEEEGVIDCSTKTGQGLPKDWIEDGVQHSKQESRPCNCSLHQALFCLMHYPFS